MKTEPAGYLIHPMSPADLDAVAELERRVFTYPWSREMFRRELLRSDGNYLVAKVGSEVIGYLGLVKILDEGHVTTISVRPDCRHRGIAKALMLRMLNDLGGSDVRWLTLEVRKSNRAAINLYHRFGFRVRGERKKYYLDNYEDAYIMWTEDVQSPEYRRMVEQLEMTNQPLTGGPLILGLETSCDETGAAVCRGGEVISNVVASQVELHRRYGGVVPELASRAHLEQLLPVTDQALEEAGIGYADLHGIAVTHGPGLIGALIAGVACAKALSLCLEVPLIAVNHLEAHIFANFIEFPELAPPLLVFLVSGGHTMLVHMEGYGRYEVLGGTVDDAAGEAFDKVARYLGLGYPGGPAIQEAAASGDPAAVRFPRAMLDDGTYNFSFSGLKTAVINHVNRLKREGAEVSSADIAASFQAAAVDVQVFKIARAARELGIDKVALAGGVAANQDLRTRLEMALTKEGRRLFFPGLWLCTDNAAMVAHLGTYKFMRGETASLDLDADASLRLTHGNL